tara:strand:- start:1283 stop:1867 length:585 start_codon:yes stop_codon:yes gene_type:complete
MTDTLNKFKNYFKSLLTLSYNKNKYPYNTINSKNEENIMSILLSYSLLFITIILMYINSPSLGWFILYILISLYYLYIRIINLYLYDKEFCNSNTLMSPSSNHTSNSCSPDIDNNINHINHTKLIEITIGLTAIYFILFLIFYLVSSGIEHNSVFSKILLHILITIITDVSSMKLFKWLLPKIFKNKTCDNICN